MFGRILEHEEHECRCDVAGEKQKNDETSKRIRGDTQGDEHERGHHALSGLVAFARRRCAKC